MPGKCYRLKGYCDHLENRITTWEIKSAYVVGRGVFWEDEDPGPHDAPDNAVPPDPKKLSTFDYTPLAAEKL